MAVSHNEEKEGTKMELREQILAMDDIESEIVEVPQWDNVKIEVRAMTARERAQMFRGAVDEEGEVDMERMYPELVIASCYDPDTGRPVFTSDDREQLLNKSGAALEKLAMSAIHMSGMDKAAEARLGKGSLIPAMSDEATSS